MSFTGKYALVTGGSRGIGRGIALKLAEMGAQVAINYYQNEAAANDTLAQVRDTFGASRKYALALLEYLDERRVTKRVGDERVLR